VAESDPRPVPPRHAGRRFVLGCFGFGALALVVLAGLAFYASWTMTQAYRNDPHLKSAIAMVRASPVAQSVLGAPIDVEDMESEAFTTTTGTGKTVSYTVKLKGARAEGSVHVMLHSDGGDMKIVSVVLTGPDDERYTIDAEQQAAPANSI